MAEKFNLFISHSREDTVFANELALALQDRGLSVWLDTQELKLGDRFADRIAEGIAESDGVVVLVGPKAAKSNWFAAELGMALGRGKKIIPVISADVPPEDIPGPIRLRHFLAKTDPAVVADEIARAAAEG
jgi:hypothetical protein